MTERILVTGAAGQIGTALRSRLARPDRVLRLLDVAPIPLAAEDESVEVVTASVTDLAAMEAACREVAAIVHLGGLASENPWDDILMTNIHGTYVVFEAARRAGVRRVVFASSNHAVGFHPSDGDLAPDYVFPRPDTYYGVSKVAGEALASLYHDRYGIDAICLRIGSCQERPATERELATWLSYDDCARLVDAALTAPNPGFRVVWGISANTRAWWSLEEARSLGYQPQDDAERYADQVTASSPQALRLVGGDFCSSDYDAPVPESSS